jgi:hypothetical protein
MDYEKTVSTVKSLLEANKEWEDRYSSYTDQIKKKSIKLKKGRSLFHEWKPLFVYTSISTTKGKIEYDLRFLGQSVATIKINKDNKILITSKDNENNKYFDISKTIKDAEWSGDDTRIFCKQFAEARKKGKEPKSHEHRVENELLVEFSKTKKTGKKLRNIQPVKLFGMFFQMRTPLAASGGEIKYAEKSGGGIDILSRVKHKNNKTHLCIMELKDENTAKEPPTKAMRQAVAYATFIASLLRSKSGNEWYKLFGFAKEVPDKLDIDVVIVMPKDKTRNEVFGNTIEVSEKTTLHLYSLYFTDDYDFTGSLKDNMLN